MEVWKEIPNTYGLLEVSNLGQVRSLMRGKPYILKAQKDKKGYLRIRATIKRKRIALKIHRVVAEVFIENPDNLPQVNHKDGNKSNNEMSNLEWISNIDNAHHAIEKGLWTNVYAASKAANEKRKRPIKAANGKDVLFFESVSAAERYFNSRHIVDVLKGRREHVKGYSFVYESEVM